ncbi:hypothetical protein [Paenarthrobacter sp. PH39-S1]|uniref:hypothetical protein n=1 Tax=Paenarthrobacter sp. PH39-S1 TaxID=3046204 RepID=UPI0024B9870F|nr:hypothetical protein [Paenarthrobacter sp. PH39-S1]MDJ0358450.1 hypothetical protein [Paenarthrobacter sp. PH39-S1]
MPLFIPSPTPADQLGKTREAIAEDGAVLRFSVLPENRDEESRIQQSIFRYEQHRNDDSVAEDRTWVLHWYTPLGSQELAEAAGLAVTSVHDGTGRSTTTDTGATDFTFTLQIAR